MVVAVADVAPATALHAAMTVQNPAHVPTDSALHKASVAPPKANAHRKARAAAAHRVRCLNNVVPTMLQPLLAPPAASATPMACAPHPPVASLTPCAPAWTAWPQAVAVPVAATAPAVVVMAAAVAARVAVDTVAAVAVPAAADTVVVAARAAAVAAVAAVTADKPCRIRGCSKAIPDNHQGRASALFVLLCFT